MFYPTVVVVIIISSVTDNFRSVQQTGLITLQVSLQVMGYFKQNVWEHSHINKKPVGS